MEHLLSERIKSTPPSFIRSILKTAADPQIISFAGGLPNPISFPQEELLVSMERIVRDYGSSLFQYSITAGLPELRQYIADRYNRRFGLKLGIENILITTGSQQALDLISKVLLNTGDGVIVEKPSYLGAIQAFSLISSTCSRVRHIKAAASLPDGSRPYSCWKELQNRLYFCTLSRQCTGSLKQLPFIWR